MTTTQNKLLIGLALISLTSIGLAFGPQWGGAPGQASGFGPGGGYGMTQQLNLTTEQQQQVQTIMQSHREEGWAWREKHHQALEGKLSEVFDAEQLEQFKAFRQQGPQAMMGGRGMRSGQGPYGRGMGPGRGQGPCGVSGKGPY